MILMKGYIFIEKVIAVELGTIMAYLNEPYLRKIDLLDMRVHEEAPLSPHLGEISLDMDFRIKPIKR